MKRLRNYARIDLRVTPDEQIYILEVNPNCYLEKIGELARAALEVGMDYDTLIGRIGELAHARYAR